MVAIILVNYNGYEDTKECIESIIKSQETDYKIIVVDNCSTDDSKCRLMELQNNYDFQLLIANSNNGFSAGNNIGINYALKENFDYILLLNNDTIVSQNFLTKLLEGFNFSENCGATIGKIYFHSEPDKIWYAGGSISKKTARTEHFKYGMTDDGNGNIEKVSFATGCFICLKKSVIESIGLLDEHFFLYEEDAEYSVRIQSNGYDIVYVPDSVIYHKVSASTGQGSPMSQYYSVRNKYYLIKISYKGFSKITAYMYCTTQFFFRCLKKQLKFKYYWAGLRAFMQKETGKTTKEL